MGRKNRASTSLRELMESAPAGYSEKERSWPGRLAVWAGAVAVVAISAGTLVAPGAVALSAGANSLVNLWEELPADLPLDRALPQHTVLLDNEGKEFARFYSENRIDVDLDRVSQTFLDTLISTEDVRFYDHHGVDPYGITRAAVSNALSSDLQGASTITQQLVQNIMVNNARDETEQLVAVGDTYNAKIRESKYAVHLEQKLGKDEILRMYVNAVYFGNRAYGVEAAARIYFNTSAAKLNLPQSALLVGLLKGPGVYDPFTKADAATARRNTVLTVMENNGAITAEEAHAARKAPLGLERGSVPSSCGDSEFPFYCELVREEILENQAFGATPEERADRLSRGGMTLTTGLDRQAMAAGRKAVTEALGDKNRAALGVAVVEPGTGHIAAVTQNRSWGKGKGKTEVVYAKSEFQVGSSMKPLVLGTALSEGVPASQRYVSNGPYYSPELDDPAEGFHNYGFINHGSIDAYEAVRKSVNVYFVKLIERTGVVDVAKFAESLGITSIPTDKLSGREASLALGAYEVSPLEMANAYASFVSGGVVCKPVTITKAVRSGTDEELPVPDADCHQAIDPGVADTVADALKEPFKSGGTLGAMGKPKGREAGAKTGTTNDFSANWIVGVTPQYSTAVWLGDPRGGGQYPLDRVEAYDTTYYDLTGSEVAGPVWKATMEGAHKGLPAEPLPDAAPVGLGMATDKSIPDVRGMKVDEAITVLLRNNLVPVVNQETAKADPLQQPGTVVAQTPAAGGTLRYRQEVAITLSAGSETSITIPDNG
ncbi:transglycosylase domain-containing protein [Crystallibacter crystallopoietes]|nr:transglycosylase domain-containing protein [Arthrobacter crystallopoietes]